MPKSFTGLLGWVLSTMVVVAVGIFILSRIPPIWRLIVPSQGA